MKEKTKDWNPVKLGRYRGQIKNEGGRASLSSTLPD